MVKYSNFKKLFPHCVFLALIPPVQTKAAFQLEEALEQIKGPILTPGLFLPNINKVNFR